MLGLGGGAVVGPVLLSLNVRPEVSTATSSVMVFFTSSVAVINFGLAGRLNWSYTFVMVCFSLVGAATGVVGLKRLVAKTGRPSLLVMTLAGILGIAAVLVPLYGV